MIPAIIVAREAGPVQIIKLGGIPIGQVLIRITSLDSNNKPLDSGQVSVFVQGGLTAVTTVSLSPIIPDESGIPKQLSFVVQPSSAAAGAVLAPPVKISILDANNDVVTNSNAAVSVALTTPGGATLGGTRTVNAVNGIATFSDLQVNNAGLGYTLTASAASFGATKQSNPFTIFSTPSKLAFSTPPTNSVQGQAIAPAVQVSVLDANGAIVTSATNTITVARGAGIGTLSGTLSVAAVNGVATFSNLSLNVIETGDTLVASSPGLTGITSQPFNVVGQVGTPSKLAFLVQPSAVVTGSNISPAVQVVIQDSAGTTVATASNTITLNMGNNPGGATLSGVLSVPAVNGVATFNALSLDLPGLGNTLVASTGPGIANATSAPFTATAAVVPPVADTRVYVAIPGENKVKVINTVTGAVTGITVGTHPIDVAVADGFAFVLNQYDSTVSVVDTSTETITATVTVGGTPYDITAAGGVVYVTNYNSTFLSAIDTSTLGVTEIPVPVGARCVAVTGGFAYVTYEYSDVVRVVDLSTKAITSTITVGHEPIGIAVAGHFAYVANYNGGYGEGSVVVIDTNDNTVVATVPVGYLASLHVAVAGGFAYVTNYGGDTVSVIDTSTNTVTATIVDPDLETGIRGPWDVAIAGGLAYVSNSSRGYVSVIDTSTNAILYNITVGLGPVGIATGP